MKKFFSLILLLILSYVAVVVGRINEWTPMWYAGLAFGSAVCLAMIIGIIKIVGKFVSESVSSAFFVIAGLSIVGVLAWKGIINAFLGYAIGTILGIALFVILFRKLAHIAQRSMFFGELFQFASNYKIRSYIVDDNIVDKQTQIIANVDYKNIVLVLKDQMGYPTDIAEEAATRAIESLSPNASLQEKVKSALQYLDKSVEVYKNRSN